ncbi:MAG: ABC transporter ATP-binding protein [Candidatus Heimdallarchaeota archaeon]|nr:MAG: ABC transporter ATP-binding protein [Candidatus Heimdallarchaeota archaeon]
MSNSVSESVLEVSNLTKIYGRELNIGERKIVGNRVIGALDVSFSVKKGEIFGFLGPNGAGKTTTMRAILDYLKIQTGTVTIFGLDHHQDRLEIRRRIGYVPGDMALFENFTGEELLLYFSKFRPIDEEFLAELRKNFRVKLHKKIKSLSTGNRQQAGLIAALAAKPDFLILDEPTSGLDPLMTANFHKIIRKLSKEGYTIFLSSHDLAEVQAVCDRVGIIKEGKMILVEAVEDLKTKFMQKVRITFNGSSVPSEEEITKLNTVISVEQTKTNTFVLKIKEDVNELLKWISNYDIKRFTCEDATLEEIFLQFYE